MISWAEKEVELSKALEGSLTGMSKKAHLIKVWKQTGRMPSELEQVIPRPTQLIYLWDWLGELMYPMSFAELESWQRLTGRKLCRWEVKALIELDKVRSYG